MVTSLKTDFAQIISRCPKKSELPKIWGGCSPLRPPARTPMETGKNWYEPPAPLTWILYGS